MDDADIQAALPRLNLDEIIGRIERQQAETRKFVAERDKLSAEALKLHRDRLYAPVLAAAAVAGAVAGFVATLGRLL